MAKVVRNDECRYCSSHAHGKNCLYSDTGYHVEVGDADHCIFCGSTAYSGPCLMWQASKNNPKHVHIHGHGKDANGNIKCIYCGKILKYANGSKGSSGGACLYSPNGKHQA